MRLTFDPAKRAKMLLERGLDFARAGEVFEGVTVTMDDNRLDYGEPRYVTVGYLDGASLSWCGRRVAGREELSV